MKNAKFHNDRNSMIFEKLCLKLSEYKSKSDRNYTCPPANCIKEHFVVGNTKGKPSANESRWNHTKKILRDKNYNRKIPIITQ